ncbi:MAG: hypothetical protein H6855_02575 [Rhodospirillales bacterium]|nr:hypothetical protein [Rhodospirillales bacterium]
MASNKKEPAELSENDQYAFALIDLFAGAIQSLNGGSLPLPVHWQEHLKTVLKFDQSGARSGSAVKTRQIEMARQKILHEIAQSQGKATLPLKARVMDLAKEHGSSNPYRDIAAGEDEAIISLLIERLNEGSQKEFRERKEMAARINAKIENGNSLHDILNDENIDYEEYSAIQEHKKHGIPLEGTPPAIQLTEAEKALAWLSDGLNRQILKPGSYPVVTDPDPEIMGIVEKKRKKSTA